MNKKISYILFGIVALVLVWVIFNNFISKRITNDVINNNTPDFNLSKYRGESIPDDCRLPDYETNVKSWKEHLSHHKQTWYCLEYYNDI